MNLAILLIMGGAIGGLAGVMMNVKDGLGIFLYAIVGMVGAMLGGWFVSPLLGIGAIHESGFNAPALLVSFVGSSILLATMNSFERARTR